MIWCKIISILLSSFIVFFVLNLTTSYKQIFVFKIASQIKFNKFGFACILQPCYFYQPSRNGPYVGGRALIFTITRKYCKLPNITHTNTHTITYTHSLTHSHTHTHTYTQKHTHTPNDLGWQQTCHIQLSIFFLSFLLKRLVVVAAADVVVVVTTIKKVVPVIFVSNINLLNKTISLKWFSPKRFKIDYTCETFQAYHYL